MLFNAGVLSDNGADIATTGTGNWSLIGTVANKYLYGTNSNTTMFQYAIDQDDGTLDVIAGNPYNLGADPHSMAADEQGKYLYVGADKIYILNIGAEGALSNACDPVGDAGFYFKTVIVKTTPE
ncbi:MAG: hypothetical protein RDV48_28620 [Candidatus Eremiobacteraeota bacterium]|nr:hypothetical protein [Candidatus Eremiobacteraeota bacterium]